MYRSECREVNRYFRLHSQEDRRKRICIGDYVETNDGRKGYVIEFSPKNNSIYILTADGISTVKGIVYNTTIMETECSGSLGEVDLDSSTQMEGVREEG